MPRTPSTDSAPPDATIVRFAAAAEWAVTLPLVPAGNTVTVSVSHASLMAGQQPALERAGYQLVGVLKAGPLARGSKVYDLLIPNDLAAAHPRWYRELADQAERVFSLSHGPVGRIFAPLLALHTQAPVGA